jgi:hypothetical protein
VGGGKGDPTLTGSNILTSAPGHHSWRVHTLPHHSNEARTRPAATFLVRIRSCAPLRRVLQDRCTEPSRRCALISSSLVVTFVLGWCRAEPRQRVVYIAQSVSRRVCRAECVAQSVSHRECRAQGIA